MDRNREIADLPGRPFLGPAAAQVTASRAEGENTGAGKEMVERFFFDRVNTEASAAAIRGQQHLPVAVFTDKAETTVSFSQVALARTEVTDDPPGCFTFMPPATRLVAVIGEGSLRW